MSFAKWIGASLGWSFGGPIGAIIGLALGSVLDSLANGNGSPLLGESQPRQRQRRQTTFRTRPHQRPKTQSGDFEVSLLILASIIIKSDGNQDHSNRDRSWQEGQEKNQ